MTLRRKMTINMPVEVQVMYELDEENVDVKIVDVEISQHGDMDDVSPWIVAQIEHDEVLDNDHTVGMTMLRDLLEDDERPLHLSNPRDNPPKPLCRERKDGDLITNNLAYFTVLMKGVMCSECLEIFNGIWDRDEEANAKAKEDKP